MRSPLLRAVPFALLAGFGAHWWLGMLARPPAGRVGVWLLIAAGVLAGLLAAARLRPRRREWAEAAVGIAGVLLALPAAGIPLGLLAPKRWDELGAGLWRGLEALPDMTIPYHGAESSWPVRVMLLGGALLVVLAALSAFRPRRAPAPPWLAAVLLGFLAGVPAVVLAGDTAVAQGILIFAALLGLLAADRLRPADAPAGVALAAVAAAGAALLFPSLDADQPWFDYEAAAQGLAGSSVSFNWDHSYHAMTWPRTGREVLRIRSRERAYWKARNLDDFDGIGWRAVTDDESSSAAAQDTASRAALHPEWVHRYTVTVRDLRSPWVIAAGDTLAVRRSPREIVGGTSPGTFAVDTDLRRGDAYRAVAYVPKPKRADLDRAGTAYPPFLVDDRAVLLPSPKVRTPGPAGVDARDAVRRGAATMYYASAFGSGEPGVALPDGRGTSAEAALESSAYAGVARLARRLAAGAPTPAAYARRIEAFLAKGFAYTENPPPSRLPLADFLLKDKRGYCQQFSGAMALLLRLGGVPARVASGFAPGRRDADTGEWVVRDLDAHSWVEAYFPGEGWVTFDPTPAASPASGQDTANQAPTASGGAPRFGNLNKDLRAPKTRTGRAPRVAPAAASGKDAGPGVLVVVAAVGALALLLGAAAALVLARRRARARAHADRVLADLERALRRSGRELEPDLTLRSLEDRFRRAPDAAGYVRAVRELRYEGEGPGPTAEQRRALRRELARGLGPTGVARSWWALPPEPPVLSRRRS